MQTLIIYDNEGFILSQMSGNVREPVGVPYIWVEMPENKYIQKIDTTTDPHTPVLIDVSLFNYELATLDEVKKHQIKLSKSNLEQYLKENPIFSTCHNEEGGFYSITEVNQNRLLAMISVTQMKQSLGIEYQPSWNESEKACTYDWTVEQLIQLSFEIELVVRPLVSKQQEMEELINSCDDKYDVLKVDITF